MSVQVCAVASPCSRCKQDKSHVWPAGAPDHVNACEYVRLQTRARMNAHCTRDARRQRHLDLDALQEMDAGVLREAEQGANTRLRIPTQRPDLRHGHLQHLKTERRAEASQSTDPTPPPDLTEASSGTCKVTVRLCSVQSGGKRSFTQSSALDTSRAPVGVTEQLSFSGRDTAINQENWLTAQQASCRHVDERTLRFGLLENKAQNRSVKGLLYSGRFCFTLAGRPPGWLLWLGLPFLRNVGRVLHDCPSNLRTSTSLLFAR